MNEKKIESPLVPGQFADQVGNISVNYLIKEYGKYNIDIRRFFLNMEEISIFMCRASGYKFYYPMSTTGDSSFYEDLQNFDWYYMPWKWEHEESIPYIENGLAVLEVGCAHGAFLSAISERFKLSSAVGLELNESVKDCLGAVKIYNQTIQEYKKNNSEKFDVVCTYQVLEHIADVRSFLDSAIECLRPGGKLIISVPNNESFVGVSRSVMNMPPHHVGLWSENSLKYLEKIYPIKIMEVIFEPLQDYHVDSYISAFVYGGKSSIISRLRKRFDKLTGRYDKFRHEISSKKKSLMGHTILVAFQKNKKKI